MRKALRKHALRRALLAKAAHQGHGEAAVEFALLVESDGRQSDVPHIVGLLEKASSAGSRRGDYVLGLRLMKGRGSKRDTERAFALLERAASRGSVDAMYATGFALGQGVGIGSDERAAVEWFKLAAARGDGDVAEPPPANASVVSVFPSMVLTGVSALNRAGMRTG